MDEKKYGVEMSLPKIGEFRNFDTVDNLKDAYKTAKDLQNDGVDSRIIGSSGKPLKQYDADTTFEREKHNRLSDEQLLDLREEYDQWAREMDELGEEVSPNPYEIEIDRRNRIKERKEAMDLFGIEKPEKPNVAKTALENYRLHSRIPSQVEFEKEFVKSVGRQPNEEEQTYIDEFYRGSGLDK